MTQSRRAFLKRAVKGGGQDIGDGDSSPGTSDGTNYGSVTVGGTAVSRDFIIEKRIARNLELCHHGNLHRHEVLARGTDGNLVAGNYIGTDVSGAVDLGNAEEGVVVEDSANNVIGGSSSASRNVVSGNDSFGIVIKGAASTNNVIAGNYVGVRASGLAVLSNGGSGVWIQSGAHANRIGTNGDGVQDVGERNVIAGNLYDGVAIEGTGTNDNVVAGNFIGTDATGTVALGGNHIGVLV